MDKIIDTIFDPKVLLAAIAGWTLRGLMQQQGQAANPRTMASTIIERQSNVARDHAVKRVTEIVDERTKRVVDAMLPRTRPKRETQIVQLEIPRGQ